MQCCTMWVKRRCCTAQTRTSILQIKPAAAAAVAVRCTQGHSRLLSCSKLAWICPKPAGKLIVSQGGFTRLLQPLKLQPHSGRELCRVLLQHLPQLMAALGMQVCERDPGRPKLRLL